MVGTHCMTTKNARFARWTRSLDSLRILSLYSLTGFAQDLLAGFARWICSLDSLAGLPGWITLLDSITAFTLDSLAVFTHCICSGFSATILSLRWILSLILLLD